MKKKLILAAMIAVFSALIYYFAGDLKFFTRSPFERSLYFEVPSFVSVDEAGNAYVIDKGMRRIVKVDPEGTALFSIEGGKRDEDSFYYAKELSVDKQGVIYVVNTLLDKKGIFTTTEQILRYSAWGKFEKTVFSTGYGEDAEQRDWTLIRRGRICGIKANDAGIFWFVLTKDGIDIHTLNAERDTILYKYPLKDAHIYVADAAIFDKSRFAYITKKGEIVECDVNSGSSKTRIGRTLIQNEQAPTLSGETPAASLPDTGNTAAVSPAMIPWEIGYDGKGNIYFSDLQGRDIKMISHNAQAQSVLSRESLAKSGRELGHFIFYTLDSIAGGTFATVVGYSVVDSGEAPYLNFDSLVIAARASGEILHYFSSASIPLHTNILILAKWLLAALTLALFLFIIRYTYHEILNRRLTPVMIQVISILFIISVSSIVVGNMALENFTSRYQTDTLNKIAQMVQTFSKVLDTEKLERINSLEHFMNDDYLAIRDQAHSALNYNRDAWNEGYYVALYKVRDNNVYSIMYYNDQVGQYPFVDYMDPGSYFYQVYHEGKTLTDKISSFEGDYLYGMGPVYNDKGEIIAIIEVGTDMYGFMEENMKLVKSLVIETLTMLVILVLVLVEISFFGNVLRRMRQSLEAGLPANEKDFSTIEMIRPLSFIISIAIFSSMAFIPVMMNRIYEPVFSLPKNVVLGLPIAAEMLFGGGGILIASNRLDKLGWKRILYAGFIILAAGLIISGLADKALTLVVARSVAGLGSGFILMGLRGLVNTAPDFESRTRFYAQLNSGTIAGLNVGVIIGALMADNFGYATVFFLMVIVIALSLLFCLKFIRGRAEKDMTVIPKQSSISTLRFFFDRKVFAYFMFIVLPTCIALSFLNYMFPVYAETIGISTSDVGRGFILNGLIVIYLGPPLSNYFAKLFGAKHSAFISVALLGLALIIFGLFSNIAGAFVTVALIGLAMSFGASLQNDYFLRFYKVTDYGEGRSVGIYEIFGKCGDMAGPLIFGAATVTSVSGGVIGVGIVIIVMFLLFLLINPKPRKIHEARN